MQVQTRTHQWEFARLRDLVVELGHHGLEHVGSEQRIQTRGKANMAEHIAGCHVAEKRTKRLITKEQTIRRCERMYLMAESMAAAFFST